MRPTFDAIFDDLMRKDDYADLLGYPRVVTPFDFVPRFTLALMMNETLTVPGTFLIDHEPLWDLLDDDRDWLEVVFHPEARLLLPAVWEDDWDHFLHVVSGGTPDREPVTMSSVGVFDADANQIVNDLWTAGRYADASAAFKRQFPFVMHRIDVLRRMHRYETGEGSIPERPTIGPNLRRCWLQLPWI